MADRRRSTTAQLLFIAWPPLCAIGCAGAAAPAQPPAAQPSPVAIVVAPLPVASAQPAVALPDECAELSNPDVVAKLDLSRHGVDARRQAGIRAAIGASAELQRMAASIDADLRTACSRILMDLGGSPPEGSTANPVCSAAAKAIGDFKAKAGGSFTLTIRPPSCSGSMQEMADCAGKCDLQPNQGLTEVRCEGGELSGECAGQCAGICALTVGSECNGACDGACDGTFTGSCSGTCNGKCDGKQSRGECLGKCEGRCEGTGSGACQGACRGQCRLGSAATCKGQCSGMCTVALKAPRCSGMIQPPGLPKECTAWCGARVVRLTECTLAQVKIKASGVADPTPAQRLIAALNAHLPLVLKISIGIKDRALRASFDAAEVTTRAHSTLAPGASSCVLTALQKGQDAANQIRESLNASVNVMASASASSR
ncbi:MAG: hypothetical protein HY898_27690 [Deltaproteobacteria bacterium]|nr:hypothetical protein [Deltaproteobacteria bacterium]